MKQKHENIEKKKKKKRQIKTLTNVQNRFFKHSRSTKYILKTSHACVKFKYLVSDKKLTIKSCAPPPCMVFKI